MSEGSSPKEVPKVATEHEQQAPDHPSSVVEHLKDEGSPQSSSSSSSINEQPQSTQQQQPQSQQPQQQQQQPTKKLEPSKSLFSFFTKQQPAPKVDNQKIDKKARMIRSDIEELLGYVKEFSNATQDGLPDISLPTGFENVFSDLSDIYNLVGNHKKLLKRHIKDLLAHYSDRSNIWNFWSNIFIKDKKSLSYFLESNFLDVSMKSIVDHPLQFNEVYELEKLLKFCLHTDVDTNNVVSFINLSTRSKFSRDPNTLPFLKVFINTLKNYEYINVEQPNHIIDSFKNTIEFGDQLKEFMVKVEDNLKQQQNNYEEIIEKFEKSHTDRKDLLFTLETDTRKMFEQLKALDEEIYKNKQKIMDLEKQRDAIEPEMIAKKKRMEDLKKEEKKDLSRDNIEIGKLRYEGSEELSKSCKSICDNYPTVLHGFSQFVPTFLDKEMNNIEQNVGKTMNELKEMSPDLDENERKRQLKESLELSKRDLLNINEVSKGLVEYGKTSNELKDFFNALQDKTKSVLETFDDKMVLGGK